MMLIDFIIIGGGIAGLSAIKAIREQNKTGSILWISNEDRVPYKRTQINKHIASGFSKDEFALIDNSWLTDNNIKLLYDSVTNIDTKKHELSFLHRDHLKYRKLVIATGKKPKALNIESFPYTQIHHVHTARQVENIIRSTSQSEKYLVIGAGVEGVETSDQLVKKGKKVVLIERNCSVLKQFFTPKFSTLMQQTIQEAGVRLMLEVKQLAYLPSDYGKHRIQIDEEAFEFDTIISTIGYSPNIKLAFDAHIKCNAGILVNEYLETSAPDVYAAGDVAEHPSGEITGLWHAAEYQGKLAGLNACGMQVKLVLKPFRMKTQVFGTYYFSVLPTTSQLKLITETKDDQVRDLYFKDEKLEALLMKNDGSRAKIYQQALMEKWSLEKIKTQLPL